MSINNHQEGSSPLPTFTPRNLVITLLSGTFTLSILALIGWISGNIVLANIATNFRPMAFSTSLILMLLCWIFYASIKPDINKTKKIMLSALSIMLGIYGFLTFLGQATGLPIIPDNFFIHALSQLLGFPIGSMASVTGLLVFLSSVTIYIRNNELRLYTHIADISAIIIAILGLIFTIMYIIGSPLIYISDTLSLTMAFTSALAFTFFGTSLIIINITTEEKLNQRLAKFESINISTQLKFSFTTILLLVGTLGFISYIQTANIHQQTETIYEHPLMMRRAIGLLTADILQMEIYMRGLPSAKDDNEIQEIIEKVSLYDADTKVQIGTMYSRYLGPTFHIDSVYKTLIEYKANRQETIRYLRSGNNDEVIARLNPKGIAEQQVNRIFERLKYIDNFARNKGNELYSNSQTLYNSLILQLIFLVIAILLLTLIIYSILLRNIRNPLTELQIITSQFHNGDLSARSKYVYNNEFGALSSSFNILASSIQNSFELKEKVATLSGLMLGENDAKIFFKETITSLALFTKSQMAAVYLLNEEKTYFEYCESIGTNSDVKQSFSATELEGEFGVAIKTRAMQHIKDIPENTRFVFNTVNYDYIPREIITLPIINGKDIIAIISLSSMKCYDSTTLKLIDAIIDTLTARIIGILAYRKIQDFSHKLSQQNAELEAQKGELSNQSAELTEQNTELEMQKNQLNEVSKLKTNFLSNMSHELRTPLNSVIALSGVLNRRLAKQIPEEEYSYLEVIERNGKHLLSLINDILDISRIEAGKEEIEISDFDVNVLLSNIITMLKPQADEKGIELIHTRSSEAISLSSDSNKIQHIMQNLISNAIKFTETGRVSISAIHIQNSIQFAVSDTGIGIAEQNLEHIFDEFRQADGSTSRKFGGTGLGLAIAKKYTELLGGTISVDSHIGEGSTFTITLPNNYSGSNQSRTELARNFIAQNKDEIVIAPPLSSSKKILLVEDSEPAIIQIKDFLEQSGYQILVARNGGEALDIIGKIIPEAMILDLMMPDIDGFELLATIRNADRTAHIPVLILTAKHITKDELRFLKRNSIYQLIQKGDVNRIELLNAIYSMIYTTKAEEIKTNRNPQIIEGKPSVLVVEDNPDNMITVRALLSDDYIIIEATDADEGVAKAKANLPNLILMDIALPGMDGIGAFKIIRNIGELQHIPVIALTASAMTTDRESILAHGFDGYIAKPIDDKLFFKTLKMVIYGTQEN